MQRWDCECACVPVRVLSHRWQQGLRSYRQGLALQAGQSQQTSTPCSYIDNLVNYIDDREHHATAAGHLMSHFRVHAWFAPPALGSTLRYLLWLAYSRHCSCATGGCSALGRRLLASVQHLRQELVLQTQHQPTLNQSMSEIVSADGTFMVHRVALLLDMGTADEYQHSSSASDDWHHHNPGRQPNCTVDGCLHGCMQASVGSESCVRRASSMVRILQSDCGVDTHSSA